MAATLHYCQRGQNLRKKIRGRKLGSLVDPALGFGSDEWITQTISAVAELACRCLEHCRDKRPSMVEVLDRLKSIKSMRTGSSLFFK